MYMNEKKLNTKSSFHYIVNELKLRILYILYSFLFTFLGMYAYSEKLLYILCKPFVLYSKNNNAQMYVNHTFEKYEHIHFIFIDIYEAFYTNIFISFFCSLYFSMPFIVYQLWCFFVPSMYTKKKYISIFYFLVFCIVLYTCIFVIHTFLLYKVLYFFLHYSIYNSIIKLIYMPRLQSYIFLYTKILFFFTFMCILLFVLYFVGKKYAYIYTYKKKFFKKIYKNKLKNLFFVCICISFISPPDIFVQIYISLIFYFFLEMYICMLFIFIQFAKKKYT